jgi:hypothetical protein
MRYRLLVAMTATLLELGPSRAPRPLLMELPSDQNWIAATIPSSDSSGSNIFATALVRASGTPLKYTFSLPTPKNRFAPPGVLGAKCYVKAINEPRLVRFPAFATHTRP